MSEDLIRYLNSFKDYKERKKILQELAIKRADRLRFKRDMIISGVLFFVTFVFVFAVIWWRWL